MSNDEANTLAMIDVLIDKTRANIATLDEVIRQIRDLSGGCDHPVHHPLTVTRDMLASIATCFEDSVERRVQQPLNAPQTHPQSREEILAAHRRAHVPGIPPKIDSDPELRAFIIARIATHTFTAIRDEIRVHFPTARQTSLSALSRWWQREGQYLTSQPQDKGCS